MASDLSHRGFHVWEFAQEQRRAALQLGLVHASDAERGVVASSRGPMTERFQHAHGPDGRVHSHATLVDGLLLSQDEGGPQLADATQAGPLLLWQLPPRRVALATTETRAGSAWALEMSAGQTFDEFEPPPPRI